MRDIYHTIRYEDHRLSLGIDENSIESSENSLQRMVELFMSKKRPDLSEAQMREIGEMAKRGDLQPVMPYYEEQIMSPLSNALFGDVVTLLLIQIQKQKTDVEKAMSSLDQIMKANEINFQALAVFPAVFLVYLAGTGVYHFLFTRDRTKKIYQQIYRALLQVEKMFLLAVYDGETQQTTVETLEFLGKIIVSLQEFQDTSLGRLSTQKLKTMFEDFGDLADTSLSIKQKLSILKRIFRQINTEGYDYDQ